MLNGRDISRLSHEEALLVSYWEDTIKHIKRDIANIWTDEVRDNFEKIKDEAEKIAFLLRKISYNYHGDTERYKKEIYDIGMLVRHLTRLEANEKWIKTIHDDLQRIISDIENEKSKEKFASQPRLKVNPSFFNDKYIIDIFVKGDLEYSKNKSILNKYGINERTWEDIVIIAKSVGKGIQRLFAYLSSSNFWLYEENWQAMVEIVKATGGWAESTLNKFPDKVSWIAKYVSWHILAEDIARIAKSCESITSYIIDYTLPALRHIINEITWPMVVNGIIELSDSVQENKYELLAKGLPSIAHMINERNWNRIIEILKSGGPDAGLIFHILIEYNIENNVDLGITEESLPQIIKEFRELIGAVPHNKREFFNKDFVFIKPFINKNTWPEIKRIFKEGRETSVYLCKSLSLLTGAITEENLREFIDMLLNAYKKLRGKNFLEKDLIYGLLVEIHHLATKSNYKFFIEFFGRIFNEIEDIRNYSEFIHVVKETIRSLDDLNQINILYLKNSELIEKMMPFGMLRRFFKNCKSLADVVLEFSKVKNLLADDRRYWTVQGLSSLGFLCCHVTNAFFGGAAGGHSEKQEPFNNIIHDITKPDSYNPSTSIIKQGGMSKVAITKRGGINGSIGVIFDRGYIYKSYPRDAYTLDIRGKVSGLSYRTSPRKSGPTALVANFSISGYNEVLLRKWTVSAIFYTKGCEEWVIDKLKQISDNLSFKEYTNGEYWYRTIKTGVPEKIIKVFPVYEIDLSNNTWHEVYRPAMA